MNFIKRIFGIEKTKKQNDNTKKFKGPGDLSLGEQNRSLSNDVSYEISMKNELGLSLYSSHVGVPTGNTATDFYVYEWFIKSTDEVFYVGKGRGNRFKDFHQRAYEAERIRNMYDTENRFIGTGLTEEQALELETQEMVRLLNETNDKLTNRIIPLFTKRGNGYERSLNTPLLSFERAPHQYANEIEEHYFNITSRPFDKVEYDNLKAVVFITRNMRNELNIIYNGNPDKYISETKKLLSTSGNKIIKSQFAKSVTAWIYIGDEGVSSVNLDQEKALERLGIHIPVYHLIDVWKLLKEKWDVVETNSVEEIPIYPIHNRVLLQDIKHLNNWEKGFDEGFSYWEEGEIERKKGRLEKAIELFDIARYNGYNAPALYKSYAMSYRKLKDYDNEIAILSEALVRYPSLELKERREKSLELRQKINKNK
ncbi:GIY-YIG nuclease family protein [Paenibacillus sp. FSL H8-0079]|uniref:GIY-YIG nuclease family protein n=1 Tax=Paenibacillus sp. FSL H8-0079 TaxID=2921375 RepID=UPI0030EC6000